MSETSRCQFITVIYICVFAQCINNLSAQNSVQFYKSSPSKSAVSTTEQASVVIEQSQVESRRSISRGSIKHTTVNNNRNKSERQLKTTGFEFKARNSNGNERQTSPIPFVIPSYASGIIFRNTDNDYSPPIQIQPAIDIATKTIGPELESDINGHDTDAATVNARARPSKNLNTFDQRASSLPTTSFTNPSTITQTSIAQNEIPNNLPIYTVSTTLSTPLDPSQINMMQAFDKTTSEPRYSERNKRIEVLGLQLPGYAVRGDGTIDPEALQPNFIINSNANLASNNLNPLNLETITSTTTQMTYTTTPRITRTTQHQHTLQSPFIPSNDNPFLVRKSKQNLKATPAPFTPLQSTTQTNTFKGSSAFVHTTKAVQLSTVNRNAHPIGNGFVATTHPSPFSKVGNNPNRSNGQLNGNQSNSRQSKSYSDLSFNAQQQSQRQNAQFNSNLDNRAQLPSFGHTETTTVIAPISPSSTTKRAKSFGAIPTAKAPAGFSFGSGFIKTATTTKTATKPTLSARTVPTTFSTIFPSKYTFSTFPTTVTPLALSIDATEPSIELLPPISSNTNAKSAFAAINEAGASIKLSKSPAFLSTAINNRNQQQQQRNTNIKPVNGNISALKANNGLPIATTTAIAVTKSPIHHRPASSTTPFKFTTPTRTPPPTTMTTTTAAAITTTAFAPSNTQQIQSNTNIPEPFDELLPPIESEPQNKATAAVSSSSSLNLPIYNDLLPPLGSHTHAQAQNSPSPNVVDAGAIISASASTSGTKSNQLASDTQSDLNLNPLLPPVDTVPNSASASVSNTPSNVETTNEYTTITLEQNPFLPQLDLNPFLPPFIFSPSENDPGFGFGAGTPPQPSSDDDETSDSSNQ